MNAEEAPKAAMCRLNTEPSSADLLQEGEMDENLQKQYCKIVSPEGTTKLHCCYMVIMVVTISGFCVGFLVRPVTERCGPCYATCPRDWIGFGSKCFYFSKDMINWTFSQTSCMELEAQLVLFDSLAELNFLKRYKGPSDHWIGLHRESPEHPWMWTDNSEYNNLVPTQGAGECAYLSDRGISSGRDYTHRKWICNKPNSYTLQCPVTSTFKSSVENISKHP